MWSLYDELIAGIPLGISVESYNIARTWTTVIAGGNIGVANTTSGNGPDRMTDGPMIGMELRDMAQLSKSWNFMEATLGVAAMNAYYNAWDKASALSGFEGPKELRDDLASRKEKNAFFAFQDKFAGKDVAVIGHFPYIEEQVAPVCNLSILERNPAKGDYPDSACEYILPRQDYVFITGMALTNKTMPRLLQICKDVKVVLLGPSVPLAACLFDYGVANLSGFICTEPERLDELIRRGMFDIFEGGQMISINKV